ncbi:MAG TPA: SpoIIE family protein phosphatase [Candidatus Acidoferrales bacterium]
MPNPDSAAARMARSLEPEEPDVNGLDNIYLRDQLERRRTKLNAALAEPAPATPTAPLVALLSEVDSALQRMDEGTYGICTECHDTVESDRLLADPLVTLCLDHLTSDEQRALERDLELAARVQRGLLPASDMQHGDWRVHYQYKPAGMVSGDYCDLISPASEGGELVFLLGDVAGKGVAASLLMTHLHAMFRSLAGLGLPLDKLLETANSVFCRSTIAGQYATLICGRATRTGEIEIGSAGHLAALVVAKDGVQQVNSTGVPLGMFGTSRYAIRTVKMNPGDSLLLYTDGISEAVDTSGVEYGVQRISNIASGCHGWVPRDIAAACIRDVQNHARGAKQFDDQTLMVIHRAAPAGISLHN